MTNFGQFKGEQDFKKKFLKEKCFLGQIKEKKC